MILDFIGVAIAVALLAGMVLCYELGRRIGKLRIARNPDGLAKGGGAVEAGVYGLLGLLVALTFSGGASRYEARRLLVTQEANAIGTAYLRIDLLGAAAQPAMRQLFRDYVDSRVETYRKIPDLEAAYAEVARSGKMQREIWKSAVAATLEAPTQAAPMLLLPALNEMFDIMTSRVDATKNHPPLVIHLLLVVSCLVAAMLVGYGMSANSKRSWLHIAVFAITLSCTVYAIIDLEYPRAGLVRLDSADQSLVDLRESMR
jgi:uncharacterized protein YneF (UPF0154 family)